MNRTLAAFALTLGLAVLGCEQSETTETDTTTAAPSVTPATPSETAASDAASDAAGQATAAADQAAGDASAAAQTARDSAAAAGTDAAAAAAAAGAATQPSSATAAEAQKLIDQTLQYIKENKMELAEKSLAQLEKMKPQIPAEYHSKIDGVRKAFDAAKAGGKLDSLLPGSTPK